MPRFARALPQSIVSRLLGAIVAAVLVLSTSGAVGAQLVDARLEWSSAPSIHALPALHSPSFQQRHVESRSVRRTAHVDVPLPVHGSQPVIPAFSAHTIAVAQPLPTAGAIARGYDATAPPVS